MISAGIIVEYNPFHNGHLFHLQQTRKKTKADVVIAAMSGNFLQRGEPALIPKFARTIMALKNGVDLVVELPYSFSTQKAEIFASGAVNILSALKCQSICFGSESGTIEKFTQTLQHLTKNNEKYDALVKTYMNKGYSYPKATSLAFKEIANPSELIDLSKPNNILGFHYVKTIHENRLPIKATTIKRIQAGYHDENVSNSNISSATSIRNVLFHTNEIEQIQSHVPNHTFHELNSFYSKYKQFVNWESLWPYLKYRILQCRPVELRTIYEVEEGIENRLIRCAKEAINFKQFMEKLKTKRYTWTRLQRICVHILTNTKKQEMLERCVQPEYIRILGFNEKGRAYLKEKKEEITLPILSKLSQGNPNLLHLDVRASNIYSFAFPPEIGHQLVEQEYKQPPIFYKTDERVIQ